MGQRNQCVSRPGRPSIRQQGWRAWSVAHLPTSHPGPPTLPPTLSPVPGPGATRAAETGRPRGTREGQGHSGSGERREVDFTAEFSHGWFCH